MPLPARGVEHVELARRQHNRRVLPGDDLSDEVAECAPIRHAVGHRIEPVARLIVDNCLHGELEGTACRPGIGLLEESGRSEKALEVQA